MTAVSDRQSPDDVLEWAYWKVKVDFRRAFTVTRKGKANQPAFL